jgi:CBS domain-containing protein
MLAVVMLELTADARMIAPVGIVCILAMLVGNMFNHGLYHGLIPIMSLPYLNALPAPVMYVTRVASIMSHRRLTWLPRHATRAELQILLQRCKSGKMTHHGFPVVASTSSLILVGLLSRAQLKTLVKQLEEENQSAKGKIPLLDEVDLTQYCDRSPLSVSSGTTVARAYSLFTKLGLRHLVVTGGTDGRVVGMVTRKDLMVFRITEFKEIEMQRIIDMQRSVRQQLRTEGFYNKVGLSKSTSRRSVGKRVERSETSVVRVNKLRESAGRMGKDEVRRTRVLGMLKEKAVHGNHSSGCGFEL